MNVRRAGKIEDWAAIHALVADAFAYMDGRIDPPSSIHRWSPDRFAAEAQTGVAYIAEGDGALLGCGYGKAAGDAWYIGKIAVAPDARRRGVARAIVRMAEADAKRNGLAALELESRIELTENHQAFAALGFAKTRETAHPGHDRPTSITMRKPVLIGKALADADDATQMAALKTIIRNHLNLMAALNTLRGADLPDPWLVSGAIYCNVWNHLTGRPTDYGVKDYDVFYFDADTGYEAEDRIIKRLTPRFAADPPVEIRNQARVPLWYRQKFGRDYPAVADCKQAIDRFACTTHCVAARLIGPSQTEDDLDIYAPFGLNEIFSFRLTPNLTLENRETHEAKAARQSALWPELTIVPWPEKVI